MPNMSGFEVAELIRTCPAPQPANYLLAGYADGGVSGKAYALGAIDVLTGALA